EEGEQMSGREGEYRARDKKDISVRSLGHRQQRGRVAKQRQRGHAAKIESQHGYGKSETSDDRHGGQEGDRQSGLGSPNRRFEEGDLVHEETNLGHQR